MLEVMFPDLLPIRVGEKKDANQTARILTLAPQLYA